MKSCVRCGSEKPRTEFSVHPGMKDGLQSWCKPCKREASKKHYVNLSHEERRDRHLLRTYGITQADYVEMSEAQDNKCAICGADDNLLVVDHCHDTGNVRGLLCDPCNKLLGFARDELYVLEGAIKYLQEKTP